MCAFICSDKRYFIRKAFVRLGIRSLDGLNPQPPMKTKIVYSVVETPFPHPKQLACPKRRASLKAVRE